MEDLNSKGQLTAQILRDGLMELQAVPIPRPAVVDEKIRDWVYTLDNHLLPEDPAGMLPGYVPTVVTHNALWILGGVVALFAFMRRK